MAGMVGSDSSLKVYLPLKFSPNGGHTVTRAGVLSIGQLKFDEHISLTKIGKSDIL